jgi:general secretion pathway protein L
MSARGTTSRATQFLTALQANWERLRGEIANLVPAGIRSRLTSGVSIVAIDLEDAAVILRRFSDDGVSEIARLPSAAFDAAHLRAALSPYLARPWFLRDSFALRLPDATALQRSLSLPLAARRNIASLLDIELERQSPVDRDEIYHDYRILRTDRAAGRIDIVWRMVRRRSVAPALDICRQAGVDLAVIAFTGDEAPSDGGNFPVATRAALLLRLRHWLVRGLLLLILALLIAVTAGVYVRNQQALDDFSLRVDQARIAARASLQLQHEIDAARQRTALLLREKQGLTITRLLAETTRLLPSGSWVTGFSYQDGEVRLQGYSNAASSLIALFDASPLFASAEFRAPLVQGQSPGQEQFDLALKIRKGAR